MGHRDIRLSPPAGCAPGAGADPLAGAETVVEGRALPCATRPAGERSLLICPAPRPAPATAGLCHDAPPRGGGPANLHSTRPRVYVDEFGVGLTGRWPGVPVSCLRPCSSVVPDPATRRWLAQRLRESAGAGRGGGGRGTRQGSMLGLFRSASTPSRRSGGSPLIDDRAFLGLLLPDDLHVCPGRRRRPAAGEQGYLGPCRMAGNRCASGRLRRRGRA